MTRSSFSPWLSREAFLPDVIWSPSESACKNAPIRTVFFISLNFYVAKDDISWKFSVVLLSTRGWRKRDVASVLWSASTGWSTKKCWQNGWTLLYNWVSFQTTAPIKQQNTSRGGFLLFPFIVVNDLVWFIRAVLISVYASTPHHNKILRYSH